MPERHHEGQRRVVDRDLVCGERRRHQPTRERRRGREHPDFERDLRRCGSAEPDNSRTNHDERLSDRSLNTPAVCADALAVENRRQEKARHHGAREDGRPRGPPNPKRRETGVAVRSAASSPAH